MYCKKQPHAIHPKQLSHVVLAIACACTAGALSIAVAQVGSVLSSVITNCSKLAASHHVHVACSQTCNGASCHTWTGYYSIYSLGYFSLEDLELVLHWFCIEHTVELDP